MRGGVSAPHISSPPMRVVFPTCVGVFLLIVSNFPIMIGIPHMRGGVSKTGYLTTDWEQYSPYAWGCFCPASGCRALRYVFPICVGVFLAKPFAINVMRRIPHMRGGVSDEAFTQGSAQLYSPYAWGCFYGFKPAFF